MSGTFRFRTWEIVLIAFSLVLFFASSTFYISGISLRKYILGLGEEGGKEQVGFLGEKEGAIKRQITGTMEFNPIEKSTPLFNFDTIVTSAGSAATLTLNGGGSIQLGPSTMVRLSFESRLSLQGISRAANIEVIGGTVTGKTTAISIALKSRDQIISITEKKGGTKIEVQAAPLIKPPPATPSLAKVIPLFVPSPAPSKTPVPLPSLVPNPIPSPSPSPSYSPSPLPSLTPTLKVQIKYLSPKNETRFQIEKNAVAPIKTISLEWQSTPHTIKADLVVIKQPSGTVLFNKPVSQDLTGKGKFLLTLNSPGSFSWELRPQFNGPSSPMPKPFTFYLHPEFEGIELLPHLVGGQKTSTNAYQGASLKKFDISLQWKPYPGAKEYSVRLYSSADKKDLLYEQKTQTNQVFLNNEKIVDSKLYYEVFTQLPTGFLVSSELQEFSFTFLAPNPVMPTNNSVVIKTDFTDANSGLLLTWQKTNFTDGYELQIAYDAAFKKMFFNTKTKENFLVVKLKGPGKFWWRVRSLSGKVTSPFSLPSLFEAKQKVKN